MAFKKLLEGFKDFHADHFSGDSALFNALVENGQAPETLIIACSDSRIDPAILTNSEPGDIFSVRNVAAMVPKQAAQSTYHGTVAAIEYAVTALKVKHIVVLGHSQCGGVRALAETSNTERTDNSESFLAQWISSGLVTRDRVMRALSEKDFNIQLRALEQATILQSLNNLLSYAWLKDVVLSGEMSLHGWYFDMQNGQLLTYDPKTRAFEDITHGEGRPSVSQKECGCKKINVSLKGFLAEVNATHLRNIETVTDHEEQHSA